MLALSRTFMAGGEGAEFRNDEDILEQSFVQTRLYRALAIR